MQIYSLFRWVYPELTWRIPVSEKKIFLTFDDGPVPGITNFVLEQLRTFQAKATFFCIGSNVEKNPEVYQQILNEGHQTGNHTYHHLNGWITDTKLYLESIEQARSLIRSELFRPPYGKIKKAQIRRLQPRFKVIMWNVLSHDYDSRITPQQCLDNVLKNTENGSIIVFHDSIKAKKNLEFVLPRVLKFYAEAGFRFDSIPST